jgi:hypothetical protein
MHNCIKCKDNDFLDYLGENRVAKNTPPMIRVIVATLVTVNVSAPSNTAMMLAITG